MNDIFCHISKILLSQHQPKMCKSASSQNHAHVIFHNHLDINFANLGFKFMRICLTIIKHSSNDSKWKPFPIYQFGFIGSKRMWFLVWLLSCVLFAIILVVSFSRFYYYWCIVDGNMDIDENGETINLEHFERTTEHLSHPQTISIDHWLIS